MGLSSSSLPSSYAGGHQDNSEPELGDLIQIFRDNYQHWAVYVGDGFVVHFVVGSGGSISTSVSAGSGSVLLQKLWDVVGKDKWTVNNSLDRKYKPRPANVIVEEAKEMEGEQLQYDLVSYNCEHFANELRYGVAKSQQVEKAEAIATTGVVGGPALLGSLALGSMASRAGHS